jgi:predicted metal-binding membrane protein
MMNTRKSDRALIAGSALTFVASATVTVAWSASMASMPGMAMPGDWTMSMAWMRMPGQSWPGLAGTFIGMWSVMMVAMMLPSLLPMLSRYRHRVGAHGGFTALAAAGYFSVWTMLGVVAFPFGVACAELAMRVPAIAHIVPIVAGCIVMFAGALQFSAWKRRQLQRCRRTSNRGATATATDAFGDGLRMGVDCIRCCAGTTAILFVLGVMDLAVMALITVAISAERLLPGGERVARGIGVLMLASGVLMVATRLTSA